MITEHRVDQALHFLIETADEAAQARADLSSLEESKKSLKAVLMKEHEGSIAAQEREAYADERYLQHTAGLKEATYNLHRLLLRREAAKATIDAWQTQSANQRATSL